MIIKCDTSKVAYDKHAEPVIYRRRFISFYQLQYLFEDISPALSRSS